MRVVAEPSAQLLQRLIPLQVLIEGASEAGMRAVKNHDAVSNATRLEVAKMCVVASLFT
jgi:hypothetical protein